MLFYMTSLFFVPFLPVLHYPGVVLTGDAHSLLISCSALCDTREDKSTHEVQWSLQTLVSSPGSMSHWWYRMTTPKPSSHRLTYRSIWLHVYFIWFICIKSKLEDHNVPSFCLGLDQATRTAGVEETLESRYRHLKVWKEDIRRKQWRTLLQRGKPLTCASLLWLQNLNISTVIVHLSWNKEPRKVFFTFSERQMKEALNERPHWVIEDGVTVVSPDMASGLQLAISVRNLRPSCPKVNMSP